MLTQEQNERLTRVGPGTPGGEMLRRYWQAVATSADLKDRATLKVRILGEDLALFRDQSGNVGLVAELCPHRRCSLAYGVPEVQGIRCPYHGWLFDRQGNCLEQPAESAESTFKSRVRTTAYPVQEMGGFFWAYLGPGQPPILPKFDYFVQENTLREIGRTLLPVNWLQVMENSVDPTHNEWLHSYYSYYLRKGRSKNSDGNFPQARHGKFGFDIFKHGIIKRRYYEGGTEEDNDWKIGHPLLFPNMVKSGNLLDVRVPVDDEQTMHYIYSVIRYPGVTAPPQDVVPVYEYPYLREDGLIANEWIGQQDFLAWVTQGRIADRTTEHLGSSDRGVLLFRRVVEEAIKSVEKGKDPLGVLRDEADSGRIDVPIDVDFPPMTPTSVRTSHRWAGTLFLKDDSDLQRDRPSEVKVEGFTFDREIVEKEMRAGTNLLSPILEEKIQMRLEYFRLLQQGAVDVVALPH